MLLDVAGVTSVAGVARGVDALARHGDVLDLEAPVLAQRLGHERRLVLLVGRVALLGRAARQQRHGVDAGAAVRAARALHYVQVMRVVRLA